MIGAFLGCTPMPTGNGNAQVTRFSATLDAEQETEVVTSNGSGTTTLTLNTERTQVTFQGLASGLTGPVTAAHFHVGAANMSGDVVLNLAPFFTEAAGIITISGTAPVDDFNLDDPLAELEAGNIYINLHTAMFPAGEIRGQLLLQDAE